MLTTRRETSRQPWTGRLALAASAFMLVLIAVGGGVTTLDAGDTEPSWSLAFWEWFRPPGELLAREGHIWEIGHRQLGTVVGFLTLALVIQLWRTEPRRWVRRLGYGLLGGVALQGVLGGVRVLVVSVEGDSVRSALGVESAPEALGLRHLFAMTHAGLAALLFAVAVCVAVSTSRRWPEERAASAAMGELRPLTLTVAAAVFFQLLAGAFLRHALLWTSPRVLIHVTGALLVGLTTAWLAFRVASRLEAVGALRRPALFVLLLAQVQIALGVVTFIVGTDRFALALPWSVSAALTSVHQLVGPVLFAAAAVLVMKSASRPSGALGQGA